MNSRSARWLLLTALWLVPVAQNSWAASGCLALGHDLDVIGIALGSSAQSAAQTMAVHADNRAVVHKFDTLPGVGQRFLTEITYGALLDPTNPVQAPFIPGPGYDGQPRDLPAWAVAGRGGGETVNVGLALPPSAPCVQGVYRQQSYRWQDGPPFDRVVAELERKYGASKGREDNRNRVRLNWHWPASAHLCLQLEHTINLNVNLARVVSPAPKGQRCATEMLVELVYQTRTADRPVVRLRALLVDGEGSARNIVAFKQYLEQANQRQRRPKDLAL